MTPGRNQPDRSPAPAGKGSGQDQEMAQAKRGFSRRWLIRGMAFMGLGGGAFALTPARSNAYYSGPVSDHFDGVRFFNPGGKNPRNVLHLARWQLTSRAEAWPASYPAPWRVPFEPEPGGEPPVVVKFIGHASFLMTHTASGTNLLIDPVLADRASPVTFAGPKRVNPPAIAFEQLPKIDVIVITHNHYDHMDMTTLRRIWQRDRPRFVTPLGNDSILKAGIGDIDVIALDWDQKTEYRRAGGQTTLTITAVPTQHWSARGTRDRMHALWASFIISDGQRTIYAVGDTGFGDGRTFRHVRQHHPNIDLALLPIGAYEPRWFMSSQHMNPEEAVAVFNIVKPRQALGHHWGTFQLTDEAIDAPPKALAAALEAAGVDATRFRALRPGDVTAI